MIGGLIESCVRVAMMLFHGVTTLDLAASA